MRSLPPPRITRKRRWRRFKRFVKGFFSHNASWEIQRLEKSDTISHIRGSRTQRGVGAGFRTVGAIGRWRWGPWSGYFGKTGFFSFVLVFHWGKRGFEWFRAKKSYSSSMWMFRIRSDFLFLQPFCAHTAVLWRRGRQNKSPTMSVAKESLNEDLNGRFVCKRANSTKNDAGVGHRAWRMRKLQHQTSYTRLRLRQLPGHGKRSLVSGLWKKLLRILDTRRVWTASKRISTIEPYLTGTRGRLGLIWRHQL